MMSKLHSLLANGTIAMRASHRLLFIGALVVIFPVLFFAVLHSFVTTARSNSETSEKRYVDVLHDAVQTLALDYQTDPVLLQDFFQSQENDNPSLLDLRLIKKSQDGFLILESTESPEKGSYEQVTELYTTSLAGGGNSLLFELEDATFHGWHAIRAFEINGEQFFVESKHSFGTIDAIFTTRERSAYLLLSGMFAFLIVLAYWHGRQIDWHAKYNTLEAGLKERDLFSTMIAHEFRTPLTAIRGYSSFLSESKSLDEKDKNHVNIILQSTDRLLHLVNDFLEVARIQSQKANIQFKPIDIQPTIIAVITALTPLAEEKGLTLSYHKIAVPVVLHTDQARLFQVLQNIISNSLKYTKSGQVEVTVDATPKAVSIRVKDTGMGISAEDQAKLFAPFSRVGGVEHSSITGSGLGMWITKQLVELMNGTLSVESIKDVGTHVIITFRR